MIGVGLHVTSRELALLTPATPWSHGTVVAVDVVVAAAAATDAVVALLGDGGTGSTCIYERREREKKAIVSPCVQRWTATSN